MPEKQENKNQIFLSDPGRIIGYPCHLSVTNSLANSCLVDLIFVTLACEDANSKLTEVVTVADVDAEKRVNPIRTGLFERI